MGRLLRALKQAFRLEPAAMTPRQNRQERSREVDEKLQQADQRLDDQATRLRILEWEAYGYQRRRRREEPPP